MNVLVLGIHVFPELPNRRMHSTLWHLLGNPCLGKRYPTNHSGKDPFEPEYVRTAFFLQSHPNEIFWDGFSAPKLETTMHFRHGSLQITGLGQLQAKTMLSCEELSAKNASWVENKSTYLGTGILDDSRTWPMHWILLSKVWFDESSERRQWQP